MLSRPIITLLERLKNRKTLAASSFDDAVINVNRLTEKAGAAYEKLRYLVDYKDERHIRRSAIERIIRRKIFLEGGENIGLSLVRELIAGRYLPNNAVTESSAKEAEKILRKYKTLERSLPERFIHELRSKKTLMSLMASEIENFFHPNNEDDFVADAFYDTVKNSIRIEESFHQEGIQTQIRVACYRSLLNADDETLRYKLWLASVPPQWETLENESEITEIARETPEIWRGIRAALVDPLSFKILPKLGNYAIYFSIIREAVRVYGAESGRILEDGKALKHFTNEFLNKNYALRYMKAKESAVRAVIYIFLTKALLAVFLEIPYQIYILKYIDYVPITTNIVFHPLLLLLMVIFIKPLGEANTKAAENGVHHAISEESIRPIKINAGRGGLFSSTFVTIYSVMFLGVFGAIVFALKELRFHALSIAVFLCFLALVSYFALRIRHSANRWKITKEEERTLTLMFNLFALPIVQAGRWLSRKFSSINVFVFVLDFIIETPFKLLLYFSDEFVSFLKDKQEDVY